MLVSRRFLLSRVKMISFLDKLEIANGATKSLYLPFGLSLAEIESSLAGVFAPETIPPELAKLAASSKTGAVLFWSSARKCLVLPPFPITEKYFAQGGAVGLRSLLKHDFRVALVLVRLGAYAIGLCHGENLVSSKVGTGLVHARHRQGGSSAQRFRRHREKQIESFLTRVCGHVREQLEPQARVLDYIVYGGAWTTILLLKKRCSFLGQFENHALPPLLDIPDPRQAVLETAVSHVWSSTVIEWYENEVLT